jgi:predicted Zn-dependent protease
MVEFMRGLGRRDPDAPQIVSYLSTHPHTAERVARLEAQVGRVGYQPVPLMTAAEWRRVTRVCRPDVAP